MEAVEIRKSLLANAPGGQAADQLGRYVPIRVRFRIAHQHGHHRSLGLGRADDHAHAVGNPVAVEPGRYLVAEAGVLLLAATQVVEKDGVLRVGCDAGMNALLRPALYEAFHDIANLSRGDEAGMKTFDVVGPICESGDVLGRARKLPADTAEGDILLVADAGAYGMAMANTYNLRALPAEDTIDD